MNEIAGNPASDFNASLTGAIKGTPESGIDRQGRNLASAKQFRKATATTHAGQ
jgi:hypothetical protein